MTPKHAPLFVAAVIALCSGEVCVIELKGSVAPDLVTTASSGALDSREQIGGLIAAVDQAEEVLLSGRDASSGQNLWETYSDLNYRTIPLVLELVRKEPETEAAFVALKWIVTNRQVAAGDPRFSQFGQSAVELLLSYHAMHPKIAGIFQAMAVAGEWIRGYRPTTSLLKLAAEKHPDPTTRGQATFTLGLVKKHNAEWLEAADVVAARIAENSAFDDTYRSLLSEGDFKTQKAQAIALLESASTDYAAVPALHRRSTIRKMRATIGEQAQAELFELTRLGIGCVAPEIEGVDLQGKNLRLSDFRGKIVLLTYWASWCAPCMQLVKPERALIDRFAGRPFVIIGVNGDTSATVALKAVKDAGIVWPSFWSGPEGPNGSIPTQWNVKGWPTTYLLDAKGVIRLKYPVPSVIEETVTRLLEEINPPH